MPEVPGPGPIDVYNSYRVWSVLVLTSWRTQPHVCCRRCASRRQLGDMGFSLALGWWGIPWGLLVTPVQITRNVGALMSRRDETGPTPQLEKLVRLSLAQSIAQSAASPSVRHGRAAGR